MQICPMRWPYWQSQHCSQAEGQLTLCRWCPVSQRSGIHMHVVTKPNSPHWNPAGCSRSTANWLTFTGKSPTCTHNPAPDGAEFLLRKSRGRDQCFCQRQVACLFTHTRKRWLEVADDYKEACWGCFLLGTTRVFWIVSCQGVLSDMMVAGGLELREHQRGKKSAQPLIQLQSCHLSAKFQLKSKHVIRVYLWYQSVQRKGTPAPDAWTCSTTRMWCELFSVAAN